jgi:hypothetical protein
MDAEKIEKRLVDRGACDEGIKWVLSQLKNNPDRGWKWIWDHCPVPSWLLWLVYDMDTTDPIIKGTYPNMIAIGEAVMVCRDLVLTRIAGRGHLLSEQTLRLVHRRLAMGDDFVNRTDYWSTLDCYVGALLALKYPRAKWNSHYFMSSTVMKVGHPMANLLRSQLTVKFEEE